MNTANMTKEDLIEMIRTLETTNELLRKENKVLRRGRNTKRSILDEMSNREKAVELLAVSVSNGELYRSTTHLYTNFQTFYCNIFRALNPAPVKNEKAGTEYIRYMPFEKANENDYAVYKEVLERCVDAIYEGKQLLSVQNKILPSKGE